MGVTEQPEISAYPVRFNALMSGLNLKSLADWGYEIRALVQSQGVPR